MRLQILFLTVLFAIICEYHCQTTTTTTTSSTTTTTGITWDWFNNYQLNDTQNYYNPNSYDNSYDSDQNSYNNDDSYDNDKKSKYKDNDDDDDDDDDDNKPSESRTSRTRKSPDEVGNINFFFRTPSRDGRRKKAKKMRFPVHRFERNRSPRFPPLLSFLPWLPIFADRLTKQTIIFSPTGGIYIIPPVINFFGQRFSIAELISSGYVSLVSSGAPPPPAVNVAPLVQPGAVAGPGIPPPNPATGGFIGGVRTEFKSFSRPKYPKTFEEQGGAYPERSRNEKKGYGY